MNAKKFAATLKRLNACGDAALASRNAAVDSEIRALRERDAALARVGVLEAALRACVPDTNGMCPVCRKWWPWDRPAHDRKHEPGCELAARLEGAAPGGCRCGHEHRADVDGEDSGCIDGNCPCQKWKPALSPLPPHDGEGGK